MAFNVGAPLVECPHCGETLRVPMQATNPVMEDGSLGVVIEASPAARDLVRDHMRGHLTAADQR